MKLHNILPDRHPQDNPDHRAKDSPNLWSSTSLLKGNAHPVSKNILSFCLETRFSQILHKQFNYAGTASTARKQWENIKVKWNCPDVFQMSASNVWNQMWTFAPSGMFGIWCELNICHVRVTQMYGCPTRLASVVYFTPWTQFHEVKNVPIVQDMWENVPKHSRYGSNIE